MPNLLLFIARPWSRGASRSPRRPVAVPTAEPSTDAIFLVLRQLRVPMVVLVSIFAISVGGLALIPGQDDSGNLTRMSLFDAFYFMSYTATTIGFGELPYPFTTAQRMWVTLSIYASVIGWAFAIATLFALLQDTGFREAVRVQQIRRKVRHLAEPFVLVAGYGQAGRLVCRSLDSAGRRFVVVDDSRARVEALASEQLSVDVPAIDADVRSPAVLGLAGLGHRRCEGVLALTDDDATNLAVVMSVKLLRPEIPVIARCGDRAVEEHMHDFGADAVINPNDRYGGYLILALQRPVTYRLASWLLSLTGTPLPALQEGLGDGRWVVCADGQFGKEVVDDLRAAGLEVGVADPRDGTPDVTSAVGLVAGTEQDITNLALAEHARGQNPDVFLSVRQKTSANTALVEALGIESVFVATELVARESVARVVTPVFWSFLDHVLNADDAWSQALLDRMVERCGERSPEAVLLRLTATEAPSLARWLQHHELRLGDLLRHPDNRDEPLRLVPVLLLRGEDTVLTPPLEQPLAVDDRILLVGRSRDHATLEQALFYDSAVQYLATGEEVPSTWWWQRLKSRRKTAPAAASPEGSPR